MFRFHYARIDQRINQKVFASRLGVPTTTYSLMEQGRVIPTEEELQRMSEILGITPSQLMVPIVFTTDDDEKPVAEATG